MAARSREFARIYDALLTRNEVVALVSSHVDYNNFGLAVEAAIRHDVPVLFPQSTGGLKAYALFPEQVLRGRAHPGRAHQRDRHVLREAHLGQPRGPPAQP